MIKFSGTLSNTCKKYIIKRAKKISFIGLSCACIIFLIPFLILSLKNPLFVICVISLLFLPLISLIPLSKKSLEFLLPEEIVIDDNLITCKGKKFEFSRLITSVKTVIDYGDWYHIFFYYHDRCQNFICQKDLIVEGTLSEFEEKFKDHIVRKEM